jgi:hypothetical protein
VISDNLPTSVKITGDIAAPATAFAYMMEWLPSTWGEWAAFAAGIYSMLLIVDFIVVKYLYYKKHGKWKR